MAIGSGMNVTFPQISNDLICLDQHLLSCFEIGQQYIFLFLKSRILETIETEFATCRPLRSWNHGLLAESSCKPDAVHVHGAWESSQI
jgi:hypothetical protein